MDERTKVGDVFYDFLYRAVHDRFIQLVRDRDDEIRAIFMEELDEGTLRSWIKDFIEYDDTLREHMADIARDVFIEKLRGMVK
jgi:hypothetical protein